MNRRTIRNYINGVTTPGVHKPAGEDSFAPFVDYVRAPLREDPHLRARTLCDELEELAFPLSYQSLTRGIRARGLRPVCQRCRSATARPNAIISHEPGDETQWDCLDLPNSPARGGGAAPRICWSGRWRIRASGAGRWSQRPISRIWCRANNRVTRALGGVSKTWRFDRMSTVCDPGSGRISTSFAGVAVAGPRWVRLGRGARDHRRFWDAMDRLGQSELRETETRLSRPTVTEFGLDLSGLALAATNFATFIDTGNEHAPVTQRGKGNKNTPTRGWSGWRWSSPATVGCR